MGQTSQLTQTAAEGIESGPTAGGTRRPRWGVAAFLVLALAVAVAGSANTMQARFFLAERFQTFVTIFLSLFIEAAPFLLAGSIVSGFIAVYVNQAMVDRFIPDQPVLAALAGAGLGFIFPVCECGVVPVTRRLYGKGLPLQVGIAFLLAAPVINPVVIMSTFAAFGWGPVLWGRIVFSFVVAFVVGLIFHLARPQDILRPQTLSARGSEKHGLQGSGHPLGGTGERADLVHDGHVDCDHDHAHDHDHDHDHGHDHDYDHDHDHGHDHDHDHDHGHDHDHVHSQAGPRARQALSLAGDDFLDMGRYLIVGALLAAAMQTLVPQSMLLAIGQGSVVSVFVMMALAFILSVCSTVDAFIALAFSSAFTTGSLFGFLVFGPMVDVKSSLLFLGVFRRRTVLYLILLPLALVALIGVTWNVSQL